MKSIEIVFIGRANAGKSTLIKELFGFKARIGRRPGITRAPLRYQLEGLAVTDFPGLGFKRDLKGYERLVSETIEHMVKDLDRQIIGVHVIDAVSFMAILQRHAVPLDVEIFEYLLDLDIDPIVAVNKIDKLKVLDETMNTIVSRLGMLPPYKQWTDRVVPISAKRRQVDALRRLLKQRIQNMANVSLSH
ncbi:MAG: GTP-binding protein EngB [Euryarchaeota archaeon]|nr:GTP-binding protein EngB [Euryarchaeota archaeon]